MLIENDDIHHLHFTFHYLPLNKLTYWKKLEGVPNDNKIKAYGQLVLLGFDVTTFTPVAYQRHSL